MHGSFLKLYRIIMDAQWMCWLFDNYSWILSAQYSAIWLIHLTIEVKINHIAHYENKLVFNAQFLKMANMLLWSIFVFNSLTQFYIIKGITNAKFCWECRLTKVSGFSWTLACKRAIRTAGGLLARQKLPLIDENA